MSRRLTQIRMTEPVRVLHLVPALFDAQDGVIGGAERYALELARHMAEEVATTILTFGDEERQLTMGQLRVRVIGHPWYVRGQRTNPLHASLFAELRKASVVHCHQQHVLASSLAAIACRLTGRRVFVSDLGGGGWDISAYFNTDQWYRGHLHISEYSRKIFGHEREPKAHVIMGGVDALKFSPDPSIKRNGTALFVGRLLPHKGINDLVNALPPDLPLEIIGQPNGDNFVSDLKKLAEGKPVSLRHDCDDAALVQAYRRALCIVLPSVYKDMYGQETKVPELLGQTLLEGMACGAPAICTNVASLPEVVEDGVTGFVVPPHDPQALGRKLSWLREHPEQAREMGLAARRSVLERFTWQKVVRRCLEIYAA
ncbi:MAG TPA: glycosyltransferase family 4 protein [Pyrinomonadaceae bacterium]|nr:glycosyltransferase family 4 protein [Pyrinomonadaceae bacterium]